MRKRAIWRFRCNTPFSACKPDDPARCAAPAEINALPLSNLERAQMSVIGERHFVGSPETIRERIVPLIEQTQADEVMILSMVHSHEARLHSYDLLAELFEVEPFTVQSAT